jgi:hypothetical protein
VIDKGNIIQEFELLCGRTWLQPQALLRPCNRTPATRVGARRSIDILRGALHSAHVFQWRMKGFTIRYQLAENSIPVLRFRHQTPQ